jgi:hypothetical protein
LHPTEKYPTSRPIEEKYSEEPVVVQDMPQMAKFVYELYMQKLETVSKEEAEKVKVCVKASYK